MLHAVLVLPLIRKSRMALWLVTNSIMLNPRLSQFLVATLWTVTAYQAKQNGDRRISLQQKCTPIESAFRRQGSSTYSHVVIPVMALNESGVFESRFLPLHHRKSESMQDTAKVTKVVYGCSIDAKFSDLQ